MKSLRKMIPVKAVWTAGRFWGTELRLHISLLLLIPYALLTFRPKGAGEIVQVLLLIASIFVCVALHEAGHTIAARLYGIEVKSITLWPLGGFASFSSAEEDLRRPDKTLANVLIVAAGPLTNLLLSLFFILLALLERLLQRAQSLPEISSWLEHGRVFPFLGGLVVANLSLVLFNLIPIYPLDGGQIARGLLKLAFGEKRADQFLFLLSVPLALGVCLLGIASRDPILILTGALLLLASASLNARAASLITLGLSYVLDRGGYYLRIEDYTRAVEAYTRALARNPRLRDQVGLYINRGLAHLTMIAYGSPESAEQARLDLDHALSLDPQNFMAWALRGELHELQSQYEQALECFNKALELRPGFAVAYADRGLLHHKLGNLPQAQADMDRAASLGSQIPAVHILHSLFRYQSGDRKGAMEDAEQALRFAPHWMLVFPEVFLENFRGQTAWVLDYYNRAVERYPSAYQAYQGRADALRVNGRLDWAIEDYHRAIQHIPQHPGIFARSEAFVCAVLHLNRGQAYLGLGLQEKAEADFRKALELPARAHIHRRAAELLKP